MIEKSFINKMIQLSIWENTHNIILKNMLEFINRLVNSNIFKNSGEITGEGMFLIELLKCILNIRLSSTYYDFEVLLNNIKDGKFASCIELLKELYNEMNDEKIAIYENELATKSIVVNFYDNIDELDKLIKDFKNKNFSSKTEIIECVRTTVSKINSMLTKLPTDRMVKLKELSIVESDYSSLVDELLNSITKENIIPTCLPFFEENLSSKGFEPKRLYLIAGTSGVGKSLFLLNFAINAIKSNKLSDKKSIFVYFTGENLVDETFIRFYCAFNKIPVDAFQKSINEILKTYNQKEIESYFNKIKSKMKTYLEKYGSDFIIYYFHPHITSVYDIKEYLKNIKELGEIKCIYVDYMDLLNGGRKYSEIRLELANVAQELKNIAIEFNIPVIVATQLNRGGYISDESSPMQISESIEKINKSDCVIYIQSYPKGSDKEIIDNIIYKKVKVSIVKQRSGISSVYTNMFYKLYSVNNKYDKLFDFCVYDLENEMLRNNKTNIVEYRDSSEDW